MTVIDGSQISDEALMKRYQQGDEEALAILYQRHKRLVESDCQRLVKDRDAARDLAGDVFVGVIRKRDSFAERAEGSFVGWIRKIARNRCLNHLKSFSVSRSIALENPATLAAPDMADKDRFNQEELIAALEQLSERQRLCLKLFHFEGMSYDAIAKHTNLPPNTVRSTIQNGRLKLERILNKRKK